MKRSPQPIVQDPHIWVVAACVAGLILGGCQSQDDESLTLLRVSSDLLTLPAPAGHQPQSAAVAGDGEVWVGTLDGGLSVLNPKTGRFRVLTPEIEHFGTEVDKIIIDGEHDTAWLKVGHGRGRLVRVDMKTGATTQIDPPLIETEDHTHFNGPNSRSSARPWVDDFALTPSGEVWVTTAERPAGIFVGVGTQAPRFVPVPATSAPYRHLASNGGEVMWAVSADRAVAFDVVSGSQRSRLDLSRLDDKGRPVGKLHRAGAAAARGDSFWLDLDGALGMRVDQEVVRPPFLVGVSSGFETVVSGQDSFVLQTDDGLWATRGGVVRPLPSAFFPSASASKLLAVGDGLSLWVGSALGLFGFDPKTQTFLRYVQPTLLPSPEPRSTTDGDTPGWRRGDFGAQQILPTPNGLLLTGSGQPPAILRSETGLWQPVSLPRGISGRDVVLTSTTNDGLPVMLTRHGVSRWDPTTGTFGRVVAIDALMLSGEATIASDQRGGIVVLSCPDTHSFLGAQCTPSGYLPWGASRAVPIAENKRDCVRVIDDGLEGWATSRHQSVQLCPERQLLPATAAIEITSGIGSSVTRALSELTRRQALGFRPLTPVSGDLKVAWGSLDGRPAVLQTGEQAQVIDNAPPLAPGPLLQRRYAVDTEGNLCSLTPREGASRGQVVCLNYFGQAVAQWDDDRGALGSLRFARLRHSPTGQLWIDGLHGKVAWLQRSSNVVNVVPLDGGPGPTGRQPLTRILGFGLDGYAYVDGRDVVSIRPAVDPSGRPRRPRPVSARRLWKRERWPMANVRGDRGANLIAAMPMELRRIQIEFGPKRFRVAQTLLADQTRNPIGPNVDFLVAGDDVGEFWVGLREGGVVHYRSGKPPRRYSRRSGMQHPNVAALTSVTGGAIAATADGLYWLDSRSGRSVELKMTQLDGKEVVALTSKVDAQDSQMSQVFIALLDGGVWRARVRMRGEDGAGPGALRRPRATSLSVVDTVQLGSVGEVEIRSLAVIDAGHSASNSDEIVVGTSSGTFLFRGVSGANSNIETVRVTLAGASLAAEVTAMTVLPNGRIAAAYWADGHSKVILHEPSTMAYWSLTGFDRSGKVHALVAVDGREGETFLAVRQASSIAVSAKPVVSRSPLHRWGIPLAIPLALLLVGLVIFIRRRDPVVKRLKNDPDGLLDLDLELFPGIDRALSGRRDMVLAGAGVGRDCWDRAVQLGAAWRRAMDEGSDLEGLAAHVARALDAELGARVDDPTEVSPALFELRLPRLPINLPTSSTLLLIVSRRDLEDGFARGDVDRLEDELGTLLRGQNQSMGSPFILVTDLKSRVHLPTLVHARFPGVILGHDRLKKIALSDHPRKSLSQVILVDCWLDAISPYKSSGPVEDPTMFMGRERVRRELISSRSISAIICGGRRVGKTSLIRQLIRDLAAERPEMTVYEISLLGIRSTSDFVDRLERRLGLTVPLGPPDPQPRDDEALSLALARIRRRRARRRGTSISPEVIASAVHEALEAHAGQLGAPPLLILDEIDGIAARDASDGYPLLSALHQLKSEGICSFVLVGFAELYRQTFDYDSPLYNFARVLQLGPLTDGAARRLVEQPLSRLGVKLDDNAIADRIVESTAGFPNLVQFICDMLLQRISAARRTRITLEDVEAILDFSRNESQALSAYVAESFDQNIGRYEELSVYTLLLKGPRPCTLSEMGDNLARLGIETTLAERRSMVRRLKLVGIIKELPGELFDLALPLLVQLLLAKDLRAATDALLAELDGAPRLDLNDEADHGRDGGEREGPH